jgi:peptidoglycan/LPS O-acetylase OafA/YrhL
VARFARIYPLYLFALLLALAFLPEPFRTDEFRRTWPLILTLTQDWWPVDINGKLASEVYVGSAWSLSAEILLYLLYIPLARAIGSLTSREGLMALCALLASMSLFTVIRSSSWGVSMGGGSYYAFYMSPYCRLPEFLLGAIIAAIYRHRSASTNTWAERSPLLVASLFSVIALLVGAYAYGGARFDNLMSSWGFAPACGGLIYYFCRNNGLPSRFVDCRPIVALGDASYSIYLLSGWGLWTFAANGASTTYATAAFREIMAVAFIVIMSLGTYHYLEIPARRAIRKSLRFQARNASALTPVVRDTA